MEFSTMTREMADISPQYVLASHMSFTQPHSEASNELGA